MSKKKKQHVVPTDKGYRVRGEGNKRLTKDGMTKEEAIDKANEIADNNSSSIVVHDEDGKFENQ